jgi:hypothetical protein
MIQPASPVREKPPTRMPSIVQRARKVRIWRRVPEGGTIASNYATRLAPVRRRREPIPQEAARRKPAG